MRAFVRTVSGTFLVDLEDEVVLEAAEPTPSSRLRQTVAPETGLPLVVASAGAGSTVVAVLDRRPPIAVSHDAGRTWRESGGGLPRGRAIAVLEDNPDAILYAARNRLFVSEDGGRFWRALAVELPEIEEVAFD